MFSKNELQRVIGDSAAVTDEMLAKINDWRDMLSDSAPWTGD